LIGDRKVGENAGGFAAALLSLRFDATRLLGQRIFTVKRNYTHSLCIQCSRQSFSFVIREFFFAYKKSFIIYGKNSFPEISKNLARYKSENNFVGPPK